MKENRVLTIDNLTTTFESHKQKIQAVRGVSLHVDEGDILAIVGESGSGKSVTMKSVMGLLGENADVQADHLELLQKDLLSMSEKEKRKMRGKDMAMIFQDPMTFLNPVLRIQTQLIEPIMNHNPGISKQEAINRAIELMRKVGIPSPETRIRQYPFQFSGGMRQRIIIAIALACDPKIIIADEPTTALDVTIQAQILKLMNDLKEKTGTSIMLITHDLGVVAQMADHVNVMYAGKVVESAPVFEIFKNPKHPYTVGLMSSMPSLNSGSKRLSTIEGNVPNPINLPKGCYFADRCPKAMPKCRESQPHDVKVGSRHHVSCFLFDDAKGEE